MGKTTKAAIAFGILFVMTVAGFVISSGVQSTWWSVDVKKVEIQDGEYTLRGKLYVPEGVDDTNPAPGVLAIHGYNNDKDVQRPHSIELSKRGIVVLAIDVLNHGDSDYANTTEVNPTPAAALNWLGNLTFVDPNKIGVTGHSMGAFYTILLALSYPHIEAIAPIAFSPSMLTGYLNFIKFGNPTIDVLHVSSWGEEFGRESDEQIDEFLQRGLDAIGAYVGVTDPAYDTTYGDFTTGASRFELLKKTHPGQTHSRKSTAAITAFFMQSLLDYNEADAFECSNKNNMVYWLADLFGVISMAGLIFSIIPSAILLMQIKFFGEVAQPMPKYRETYAPSTTVWWIFGLVNATIGFLTYTFNTEYYNDGPRAGDWVFDGTMIGEALPNIYRSGIANDFLAFYLVNAGVMILIVLFWSLVIYRPKRVGFYELGVTFNMREDDLTEGYEKPHGWRIFGKTLLIAMAIFLYMYGVTFAASFLNVELRGPWSGLKLMTWERAVTFWYYFPGVLLFFIFNAGIWMFGMMRQKEQKTEAGTVFIWWIKICVVMLTGLLLLNILQYVPMYIGLTGPFLNDWSIAPMNVLQLWSFYPIAAGYFLILVIFFRKTGKMWLGSIICSSIATWMMVTSYIMF
ncbi:MAG: alpha/beta fold hydrolase [Candidatus Lokiarchaeota archaeon]|nr:alpha/beta fold hydrolase [Candidatus Lokiarchaeota archaeon]